MNVIPRHSIAKKGLMAATGLMLCMFLVLHLAGNLTLLLQDDGSLTLAPGGPQSNEFFEWVAHHYEAIPAFFHTGELLLLALFGIHALFGITLWLQNRAARGSRYVRQRSEGGRTVFSATMPYTGLCFIAVFLVIHLVNFRFGSQEGPADMYTLVGDVFGRWYWMLIYVAALGGVAFHLGHGVQSAFQSLGLRHPRYTPVIRVLGYLFAAAMFVGFGCLPILFYFNGAMS